MNPKQEQSESPEFPDTLDEELPDSEISSDINKESPEFPDTLDGELPDSEISSDINKLSFQTKGENFREQKRKKLNREHERHTIVKPSDSSEYPYTDAAMECAFCHSFRITKVSGPMLHYYDNGKPLKPKESEQTAAVHVHELCLEWTPQVYFDGETAMNLKVELSRASRLKCSKCGVKGAALGCYFKSCRKSYHIPCAFEMPNCRWDKENYHVLCPLHSSKELPCDSSKCKKTAANNSLSPETDYPDTPNEAPFSSKEQSDHRWTAAPHATNIWILCGSALSTQEKDLLDKFANLTGATVTEMWKQYVTHVIASTDEHGACHRTFKVLMATLSGKWVLTVDWIKACMEARHPVAEEQYEVGLDIHGCVDGPKKGRARAMNKAPKLFAGLYFYFSGYFKLAYRSSYESLIVAAGGIVLNKDDFLTEQDSHTRGSPQASYVIYNADPPQECSSRDSTEVVERRFEAAKSFAGKIGCRVIAHTWLVDVIAASSLEPT